MSVSCGAPFVLPCAYACAYAASENKALYFHATCNKTVTAWVLLGLGEGYGLKCPTNRACSKYFLTNSQGLWKVSKGILISIDKQNKNKFRRKFFMLCLRKPLRKFDPYLFCKTKAKEYQNY